MSKLSNLPSYPLSSDGKDFYFVTDEAVPYEIYLTSGKDYIPDEPFSTLVRMVGFRPLNKEVAVKSGADLCIHQTIIKALFLYFQEQPDIVLVYVCDMMDGKQRQQSLLFDRWFREFGEGYTKLAYTDHTYTYCGMIFRGGHPYAAAMTEAVDLYIRDKEAL